MIKSKTKHIKVIILAIFIISAGFMVYLPEEVQAESASKDQLAYVDLWAVFNVHPEKARAESELNKLAQSMQTELEEKAKDLPKEQQQELLKDYQTRLSQREQELIQNIIESIKGVVVEVAQKLEVKMVLDKKNVIYGGYDMTDDVIDYINKAETTDSSENNKELKTDTDNFNQAE